MIDLTIYLNAVLDTFYENNLGLFIIAIVIFQLIDLVIGNKYDINIYQVATFLSLYSFINLQMSVYTLIMGGIVATLISYIIYIQLTFVFKKTSIIFLNVVTFISVITVMILLNCLSIPAIAYTLMSYKSIPLSNINYLLSYILGTVIIYFLCLILYFVGTYIHTHYINDNHPYTILKQNLSDWNFISNIQKANQKILQKQKGNRPSRK